MPGETFVQISRGGIEQHQHALVLAKHLMEEQFRLSPEGLTQILTEVRVKTRIGHERLEIPQVQPLIGEIRHERLGSIVFQHPPHLLFEYLWTA